MSSSQQQAGNINDNSEPLSFDETVRRAVAFFETLPDDFAAYRAQLAELQTRLSKGRLHFAVLGQFNRGKSTFINALLRMKALPTSVLPLTSVPTVIEYGAEESCRIRFQDGQDALVIRESTEDIEHALREYVAEENNPQNKYKVKDATVTCKSDILANGTILIDTPGFGSTHLHNTQTTLDLLIECDAALFLLSADPPMTQTEMEFLRMVKERVPKLFFILNKVDLLSGDELDEVDRFITNILTRELGFPPNTGLYRTCAVKGVRAETADVKDKDWEASGLEAVKKEVLDFMVREKYFTLSEALSEKYDEAMTGARALLEKKLSDKLEPINQAKQNIAAVTAAIQALSLELESQMKKTAEEKDACDKKIRSMMNDNVESYSLSMKNALDVLLSDKYFPAEAATIASTLLPKHASDVGVKLLLTMIESANKTIRALVMSHSMALTNLQKRYDEYFGEQIKIPAAEELASSLEIGIANIDALFGNEAFPIPQPRVTDIFRKKSVRFDAIREFYEPLCVKAVSENLKTAETQATTLINDSWKRMVDTVQKSYRQMIDEMNDIWQSLNKKLEAVEAASKTEIGRLRGWRKEMASYGF